MSASRFTSVLSLILTFSPLGCLAQSESASNPTASAWGQVLLAASDRPIRHARVDFVSAPTGSGDSKLTDDKGRFDFEGLAQVTYRVIVSAPGYQKLEGTADIHGKTGPMLLRLRRTEETATPLNNDVVPVQELKMSDKAEKTFNKGAQLLLKGQPAQSLAYFERAIAKDPSHYRAYHDLGLAYVHLGRTHEAEAAFQKAIDLTGGGYAPADFAMGLALCQDQDYRRAETVIQRGLEIDPRLGHREILSSASAIRIEPRRGGGKKRRASASAKGRCPRNVLSSGCYPPAGTELAGRCPGLNRMSAS
jgi:hypothetical protein